MTQQQKPDWATAIRFCYQVLADGAKLRTLGPFLWVGWIGIGPVCTQGSVHPPGKSGRDSSETLLAFRTIWPPAMPVAVDRGQFIARASQPDLIAAVPCKS